MKISEISKELGIESKEIISFVNQKGIECKAATKNLTDEETDMVRKAFSKKEEKKETKPSAETKDKAEQKTEVKSEKPVQSEVKSEKAQNTQNAQASEKKSSKFNFKINPQFISNSSSAQKRPNQPQGQQQNRNQAQNRNVNQGPIKLIKPTTPPSQAPSVNIVPERPIQNAPKNNVKPKEELKQETPVAYTSVPAHLVRVHVRHCQSAAISCSLSSMIRVTRNIMRSSRNLKMPTLICQCMNAHTLIAEEIRLPATPSTLTKRFSWMRMATRCLMKFSRYQRKNKLNNLRNRKLR